MSKAVCQLCGGPKGSDHVCPSHARLVGMVLDGRYTIDGIIGQGGMGMVFRATQVSVRRPVAVKTLHPGLAAAPQFFERFRREAEVASALRHPNVITIFDFGKTQDAICYFVMEMLEGESLKQMVKHGGPLSLRRTAEIMEQAARGLFHAHQHGVIHRDLKPHNIMVSQLDGKDFVKVLDFGLVKALEPDEGDAQLTSTGQVLGTPQYMPPEQASGEAVDQRSDLYALTGVFYYCLTGSSPFGANTVRKALTAALSQQIPSVDSRREGAPVPKELEAFFRKGLAKDKKDRHQSCEELIQDFRAALAGCTDAELDARPHGSQGSHGSMDALRPQAKAFEKDAAGSNDRSVASQVVVQSPPLWRAAIRALLRSRRVGWVALFAAMALCTAIAGGMALRRGSLRPKAELPPLKIAVPVPSTPPPPVAVQLPLQTQVSAPTPKEKLSPPVAVRLESEPTGAEVYEGNVLVGATPLFLALPRNQRYALSFQRDGFHTEQRSVDLTGFTGDELYLPAVSLQPLPHRTLPARNNGRAEGGPAARPQKEEAKKRKGNSVDMMVFE